MPTPVKYNNNFCNQNTKSGLFPRQYYLLKSSCAPSSKGKNIYVLSSFFEKNLYNSTDFLHSKLLLASNNFLK